MNYFYLLKLAKSIRSYDINSSNKIYRLYKFAGKLEDLIEEYPNYELELRMASLSVKPNHLLWVVKQLDRNESIHEIINMVAEFIKYTQRLTKKDLYQYQSLGELRDTINNLENSKTTKKKELSQSVQSQSDIIYKDENYLVVHPHSREASCYFGKGTRWCVAATTSKNYFNDYSAQNIFLYYILTRQTTEQDNPLNKIAYAHYKNTQLPEGIEIFNANDDSIGEDVVQQYLGDKYILIKAAINKHLSSQEKTKYNQLMSNLTIESYQKQIASIRDPEELSEFKETVIGSKINPELLNYITLNTYDLRILCSIAQNSKISGTDLSTDSIYHIYQESYKLLNNKELSDDLGYASAAQQYLAGNPKTPVELLKLMVENYNGDKYLLNNIIKNPSTPDELIIECVDKSNSEKKSDSWRGAGAEDVIKNYIFEDRLPLLNKLMMKPNIQSSLAQNAGLPKTYLRKLYEISKEKVNVDDYPKEEVEAFGKKIMRPVKEYDEAVRSKYNIKLGLAKNPSAPENILVEIYDKYNRDYGDIKLTNDYILENVLINLPFNLFKKKLKENITLLQKLMRKNIREFWSHQGRNIEEKIQYLESVVIGTADDFEIGKEIELKQDRYSAQPTITEIDPVNELLRVKGKIFGRDIITQVPYLIIENEQEGYSKWTRF